MNVPKKLECYIRLESLDSDKHNRHLSDRHLADRVWKRDIWQTDTGLTDI